MNGNGRHNHYKLGDEIGKIKNRLKRLESAFKILRASTPDNVWKFFEECVVEVETLTDTINNLQKTKDAYNYIGDFTDF